MIVLGATTRTIRDLAQSEAPRGPPRPPASIYTRASLDECSLDNATLHLESSLGRALDRSPTRIRRVEEIAA